MFCIFSDKPCSCVSLVTSLYIYDQICQKGSYTRTVSGLTFHYHSTDSYNNRPTVHACTIAKSSMVCFYWGLIHGPAWRPRMLRWSVNGSNLPSQADRWQGITTGLVGETGHRCSYILRHVELKTAWIEAIWP